MKRLFVALPFVATLFGIWAFLLPNLLISSLAFGSVMPALSILYGLIRNFRTSFIDKIIYLLGFFGFISDAVLFILWGEDGQILQIFMTMIIYWFYISIFINEGVLLVEIKKKELVNVALIIIITLSISGIFIVKYLSDNLFFMTLFFAITDIVFVIFGYFYFSSKKAYLILFGVLVILTKDVFYALYFYTYHILILFIINCWLNVLGYYLLTIGIAKEQNLKEKNSENTI